MKNGSARGKRFRMVLIAGVLAVSVVLPAFAARGSGTLEAGNQTRIEVSAYCEEPIYSVELEWGSMEFEYQFGTGWNYTDPTFNQIKITNSSLAPVGVDLTFEGNFGYTGTFNTEHNGTGTQYDALYLSAKESSPDVYDDPSGAVYLILNDKRPTNTSSQRIGEITINLVDVIDDKLGEFENQYQPNRIAHITKNSELVTFDSSNLER